MVTLKVDTRVSLYPVNGLPGSVLNRIKARLTFDNPRYLENKRRGFSNWNVPSKIIGYQLEGESLIAPRGFVRQLVAILRRRRCQLGLKRKKSPRVNLRSQ